MRILILGATGSIGTQTIQVLQTKHQLVGISFANNVDKAIDIIKKHNVPFYYSPFSKEHSNVSDYEQLIDKTKPDLIVNAITGYEGLRLSYLCLSTKHHLALANKESLVMAGKFLTVIAKQNKLNIYPIDSEHSSLYQLLKNNHNNVKTLYITCSGGKYYFANQQELDKVTYEEAIKHPNWSMGNKISIDSATLINKCFEIVEAYWLFNNQNIIALYHPQSIIHAMVEYCDMSVITYSSQPDMKIAIASAINAFEDNINAYIEPLSFNNLNLTLDYIDKQKHKPIKWAYEIMNDENNCLGTIVNVSNEIAIDKFKNGEIRFSDIIPFIEQSMTMFKHTQIKSVDDIFKLIDTIKTHYL